MCACACRDKPRLVSDGEKMALLYNIACCHSQMQDARSGLVALAGALLAGSEAGEQQQQQCVVLPAMQQLQQHATCAAVLLRLLRPGF